MQINGWQYYNHAAIPTTAPHEIPDISPITDGSIWKSGGTPLLARWTTEYDCGYETNWWYVIKDTPFDINALKAKRRYEINKGNKNFVVKEINPREWSEQIYKVAIAAFETYPESYRPNIEHDRFVEEVRSWDFYKVYGSFSTEDGALYGYAYLKKVGLCIDFCVMKANPEKEKLGLNAAMVNKILVDHVDFLSSGGYICDGARSIYHESAFQDYLEKYFGFRKAYCKLHVVFRAPINILIKVVYPFRKQLKKMSSTRMVKKLSTLLLMEEIKRTQV